MNRKNAFSYFMWFIYSAAVCTCLLGTAGILSQKAGYSMIVGCAVGALWLALCGLIVFLIHKLVSKYIDTKENRRIILLVVESLTVVILFAVGIYLRVIGLSGAGEDASYFELTKVAEGQTIPSVVHGAVYIYLQLLHFVYCIFGNKFLAGIWLQIVLQLVAAFFLYRAVRKEVGVLGSLLTFGFVMIAPIMVEESLSLSPEMLFMAIYAFALYVCASCISGKKSIVACLLTGAFIGFVCYLDVMGVTLLLLAIVGVLTGRGEEERSFSGRLVSALLCVLGCVVTFLLLLLMDSLLSAKDFWSIMTAWFELYSPSSFVWPEGLGAVNQNTELLLLLLIMGIGIFSYWCNPEKEFQSIWVWLALAFICLQCFGMTTSEVNVSIYLYIVFAILAAAGLQGLFGSGEDEEWKPLGKLLDQEDGEAVIPIAATRKKESGIAEKEQPPAVVAKPDEPEKPQIKLLENPLPLPKKHVKKVLDYDIDLVAGQEDYDLVVDDNDDYDI